MAQCDTPRRRTLRRKVFESIAVIHSQVKMTTLINQMLDIARLEMRPENYPMECDRPVDWCVRLRRSVIDSGKRYCVIEWRVMEYPSPETRRCFEKISNLIFSLPLRKENGHINVVLHGDGE